ncbi:MAG: hypothetical protein ACYDCK_14505 [Thermoplasmatota archaeon]
MTRLARDARGVTDAFARERIHEKIAALPRARERAGLERLSRSLERAKLPASTRLHLIAAVAHLSQESARSLPARLRRAEMSR